MVEVVTNFKIQIGCPCTDGVKCKKFGTPKTPFRKDGVIHIRGCDCRRCKGRNVRAAGKTAEGTSRKRHGIAGSSLGRCDEELEDSPIWRSAKSGGAVKTLATCFHKHQDEQEAKRPVGNNKPFILDAIPKPNGKEVITCFSHWNEDQAREAVFALAVLYGLIDQ